MRMRGSQHQDKQSRNEIADSLDASLLQIILFLKADFKSVILGTTDLSSESAESWQKADQLKEDCYLLRGTRKADSNLTD